jgi:uncharacterized protein (TIGR02145 family)
MKRVSVLILLSLTRLFAIAQDTDLVAYLDADRETKIDTFNQNIAIREDNSISSISHSVMDGDGNIYSVVRIGSQVWMAENLKTTKFNDGIKIPMVPDNEEWRSLNSPGFCWYNNDAGNFRKEYGALYNWHTVSTGKLCPVGWHVPSQKEWNTLINYFGENNAGKQLKDTGTEYWESPNMDATNLSGFTARPGGSRWDIGIFIDEGVRGRWWSSTEFNNTNVWDSNMSSSYSRVTGSLDDKKNGLSVRCIKN